MEKKFNPRQQKIVIVNHEQSKTHNEIFARELVQELEKWTRLTPTGAGTNVQDSDDRFNDFSYDVPRKLEKLILKYFQVAKGPAKSEVFISALAPEISKLLQTVSKTISTTMLDKLNSQRFEESQLRGKYEASQEVLAKQREMTQQIINEAKASKDHAAELYEKRISHLQKLLEESNSRGKPDGNFERLVQKFSELHSNSNQNDVFKLILKSTDELREEQTKWRQMFESQMAEMKSEREVLHIYEERLQFKNQREQMQLEHAQAIEVINSEKQNEIDHLTSKIRQFERREAELNMLLKTRENEVKMLQERIKADENLKQTQIEFSGLICNVISLGF